MNRLHVFALNAPVTVSHTNLTRQTGAAPTLPPLAEWLGLDTLDTDRIELFAPSELGEMALSDYIRLAFAPEGEIPAAEQLRLNALDGAVLLVPEAAMGGAATPGPEATLVAAIPLAQADHAATLPKAGTGTEAPTPAPHLSYEREGGPPIALFALLAIAAFAAFLILFGWT